MAKLDMMAVMMFILRMGPAIFFILIMMFMFYSFKVDVKGNDMKRFSMELSDALVSSPLTVDKAVFDPFKLTEAEQTKNIELYDKNCEYGYSINVESVSGQTACSSDGDCANFCKTSCGLSGAELQNDLMCLCSRQLIGDSYCSCKKTDTWQDKYQWGYGYKPSFKGGIAEVHSDFPVGIMVQGDVLPAKLTINAYDSFLTRLTCLVNKSYELRQAASMKFSFGQVTRNSVLKMSGTHACLYYPPDKSYDCRYAPELKFLEKTIDLPTGIDTGFLTAYPLKTSFATCSDVKSNPDLIAGKDDTAATVLLCAEAEK